ncbi:hypothetical protein F0562_021140 [Nyssa sinensis]|uniref:HTH myb-type domain-containing protein n=1 Tax=Nyssa sinensis TaxID=561372 RepID=A0A5J5BJR4_9ASTE|nr:hypothetical protein F0562_021140 [Nyssa sinensis]
MNLLGMIKMPKKDTDDSPPPQGPVFWIETSDTISRHYQFEAGGQLSVKVVDDSRAMFHKMVESFLNKFFPSGYPYSVNEGYLRYTQFRALQHFSSAALSVLSTQSLLFAAGLRPTPAQATAVSWILKDGMQHAGKLICSSLGARMDSEPKSWRILADVLYDLGTGLEVLSPLCPHLFLEMAGIGNFAKGMAVVAARATRLPIYSSFAKEGNLSDLFAKGEAISTLFNVVGLGAGIQLASTICSSMQGKLVVGSLLAVVHVYSVSEEMRAAPVNTLNPQRTAMIVADFLKTGKVSSPADLRYQEDLIFPGRLIEDAGNVKVGRALHKVVKPSKLRELKTIFPEEKFLLNHGTRWTDMVLEQNATGEDALRGWLVAAYAANLEKSVHGSGANVLQEAYERMNRYYAVSASFCQFMYFHGTGGFLMPELSCTSLLRCGKSCRLRWTNYLRPDIKRGNFSKDEEDAIINLHAILGNRWSAIAARLPGRTDNEIKNVWHTHLKKRLKQNQATPETKSHSIESFKYDHDSEKEPKQAILETPEYQPVSPQISSSDMSTVTSSSHNNTCSKVEAFDNFPEVDEDFWSEVWSAENSGLTSDFSAVTSDRQLQFPLSPLQTVEQLYGYSSSMHDGMDFWFNLFTRAGDLPELPNF